MTIDVEAAQDDDPATILNAPEPASLGAGLSDAGTQVPSAPGERGRGPGPRGRGDRAGDPGARARHRLAHHGAARQQALGGSPSSTLRKASSRTSIDPTGRR